MCVYNYRSDIETDNSKVLQIEEKSLRITWKIKLNNPVANMFIHPPVSERRSNIVR